jgi:hypothetical protein
VFKIALSSFDRSRVYCSDAYNFIDLATIVLSLTAIGLYFLRVVIVRELTLRIAETKGNKYIRFVITNWLGVMVYLLRHI